MAADQSIVTCEYCQQSHSVVSTPSPTAVGGRYRAGDMVAVEWGGAWWPASVLKSLSGGSYRVHYDGWNSTWDEDVPASRIARREASLPGSNLPERSRPRASSLGWVAWVGAMVGVAAGVVVIANRPRGSQPASAANCGDARLTYSSGQAVKIEWHGSWWPGRILRVEGQGRYHITYDGYDASWNETVGSERLCPK